MDIPTTRREARRQREARKRGVRALRATLAVGIIGALTMSGVSMAAAAEAPSEDQTSVITEVVGTPPRGSTRDARSGQRRRRRHHPFGE